MAIAPAPDGSHLQAYRWTMVSAVPGRSVPVLTGFGFVLPSGGTPQVDPPVKVNDTPPENVSGEYAPELTAPENAASGVSVSASPSVPVPLEGFVFGVHLNFAAPAAGSPASVNTEHDTGPVVVNVAL